MSTETPQPVNPNAYQEMSDELGLNQGESTILMCLCQATAAAVDTASFDDDRRERILQILESLHVEICAGPVLRVIHTLYTACPKPAQQPQEQDAK